MTAKITDEQLAQWEELCGNATEGEWHIHGNEIGNTNDGQIMYFDAVYEEDQQFIAEARTAFPALLEAYKEVRQELEINRGFYKVALKERDLAWMQLKDQQAENGVLPNLGDFVGRTVVLKPCECGCDGFGRCCDD